MNVTIIKITKNIDLYKTKHQELSYCKQMLNLS